VNIRELRESLGVELIVEGVFLREGDIYKILISLVETEHGYTIWSGAYESRLDAITKLATTITTDLMSEVKSHAMIRG
jgi:TolB-like protein